jgi:histidine triad (HIT) family protein
MSADCIFCKIVAGSLPSAKVYEDADTVAFMDINPVVKGHTLVIPKKHCDQLMSVPPEILQKLILVAQKIAQAQIIGLDAIGLNLTQANGKVAGQIVPHIHFHVIPRFEIDEHVRRWNPGKYDSIEEMNSFAEKIKRGIR